MYNIVNSISFVNLYTEPATVIRLAVVVVFFFKSGIQMCATAMITEKQKTESRKRTTENSLVRHSQDSKEAVGQLKEKK